MHSPTSLAPPPLRIGDAARLLGVSVATLRRWANSGHVPSAKRPSGQRVFYAEELAQFLPARTVR